MNQHRPVRYGAFVGFRLSDVQKRQARLIAQREDLSVSQLARRALVRLLGAPPRSKQKEPEVASP